MRNNEYLEPEEDECERCGEPCAPRELDGIGLCPDCVRAEEEDDEDTN